MTEISQKEDLKLDLKTIIELIIISIIIADTFLLILVEFYPLNEQTVNYIIYFDLFVCFILFCEFMYRIKDENNKKAFIRKNWFDIIAMIPIDFFVLRIFRFVRVLKVLKVLKVVRLAALSNKSVKEFIRFIKETHLDWTFGILIISIASGTIFFYILEKGNNPNIQDIWDSLWYVAPTLITTGSDINPYTDWGRIIGLILMLVGLIFFGMFTASVASWLVKKSGKEQKEEDERREQTKLIKEMQEEIKDLKELIKENK